MSNKIKLGKYIEFIDIRNTNNKLKNVMGVSTKKIFRKPTSKVNLENLSSYKLVMPGQFSSVQTTHNEKCFAFAYNDTNEVILVSSTNLVFEVNDKIINPRWLQMFFSRSEFDRYARFHSWGSARETFNEEDISNIQIELPDLEIQNKYVAIYESLLRKFNNYNKGLGDIKLVCDSFIENLRKKNKCFELREFIEEVSNKNTNNNVKTVLGVDSSGTFCNTKANMTGIDISKYKIVKNNEFAYNPSRINLGSIALCNYPECIVSPMYQIFKVKDEKKLDPVYLNMWLHRSEFLRSTLFYAVGSVRNTFDLSLMYEVKIPIPSLDVQKSIASIYSNYQYRLFEGLKLLKLIHDISPILIRGSILESRK